MPWPIDALFDFRNTKLSFDRSIWSYHKIQRLVGLIIRGRSTFMNRKKAGLVLDVGCGPNARNENINLDYEWRFGVDVCCDITKGLPFKDAYVSGIFTEHCIEHILFDDAVFVFREFFRVMTSRSWTRIIVPDLEIYFDNYEAFRTKQQLSMPYAEADRRPDLIYSPAMSINRIFRAHGHRFIYDFATLNVLLEKAGFINITKARFGESRDSRLLLDSPSREIESLYVEAQKP